MFQVNYSQTREYQNAWRAKNKDRVNNQRRQNHSLLKYGVFNEYGWDCACCGICVPEFLTIDHINNDGSEERRQGFLSQRLYYKLAREGYPRDRYQVLCYNCNQSKGKQGGVCAHKCVIVRETQASLYYQGRRNNLLSELGGICESCGENNIHFLSFDHRFGNGNKDRKRGLKGPSILADVKRDPGKYRVLCYNCNCSKIVPKEIAQSQC